jgi:hypothetical protein
MKTKGSKAKLLDFLMSRVGQKLTVSELREAAGNASEWARRLRELRDEEGYRILSHKDSVDLKPGEYILESTHRNPQFRREISKETRAVVLERNGYTCQMCGVAAGDPDPFREGRTVRLTLGHIIDKSKGGEDIPSNLRAVCSNCNEGLQNATPAKPDLITLLATLRRASVSDQEEVLKWLLKKFRMQSVVPDRK